MADKRVLPSKIFLLIFIISSFMIVQIPTCHGGSHHPFAAKSSLLRFWRRVLPNARLPPFLLQKASPLNATSVAVFAGYIANHTLSDHIASFCTAADLLCTRSMAVAGDVMCSFHCHWKYDRNVYSYPALSRYKDDVQHLLSHYNK
uniref:Uncharacterized protein n=1 Tax=Picea sitchensis TaxID=3332 RepID=A9NY77_PICSI|nr:unknown [Picea sitchensis]